MLETLEGARESINSVVHNAELILNPRSRAPHQHRPLPLDINDAGLQVWYMLL